MRTGPNFLKAALVVVCIAPFPFDSTPLVPVAVSQIDWCATLPEPPQQGGGGGGNCINFGSDWSNLGQPPWRMQWFFVPGPDSDPYLGILSLWAITTAQRRARLSM